MKRTNFMHFVLMLMLLLVMGVGAFSKPLDNSAVSYDNGHNQAVIIQVNGQQDMPCYKNNHSLIRERYGGHFSNAINNDALKDDALKDNTLQAAKEKAVIEITDTWVIDYANNTAICKTEDAIIGAKDIIAGSHNSTEVAAATDVMYDTKKMVQGSVVSIVRIPPEIANKDGSFYSTEVAAARIVVTSSNNTTQSKHSTAVNQTTEVSSQVQLSAHKGVNGQYEVLLV